MYSTIPPWFLAAGSVLPLGIPTMPRCPVGVTLPLCDVLTARQVDDGRRGPVQAVGTITPSVNLSNGASGSALRSSQISGDSVTRGSVTWQPSPGRHSLGQAGVQLPPNAGRIGALFAGSNYLFPQTVVSSSSKVTTTGTNSTTVDDNLIAQVGIIDCGFCQINGQCRFAFAAALASFATAGGFLCTFRAVYAPLAEGTAASLNFYGILLTGDNAPSGADFTVSGPASGGNLFGVDLETWGWDYSHTTPPGGVNVLAGTEAYSATLEVSEGSD